MATKLSSATLLLLALVACGARSTLDDVASPSPEAAVHPPARLDAMARADAVAPRDAGKDAPRAVDSPAPGTDATEPGKDVRTPKDAGLRDPCRSALLAGAPRAMLKNCSTRDGRSRASGPSSPHVTWTTRIAKDTSGRSYVTALAADASGGVYLEVGDLDNETGALVRLDGATGVVDWTTPFDPLSSTYGAPLLPLDGAIELVGAQPSASSHVGLDRFVASSGDETSVAVAAPLASLGPVSADPAVGSDGALFVAYDAASGMFPAPVVSRLTRNGAIGWTSADLHTVHLGPGAPPITAFDELEPTEIALGLDDSVVLGFAIVAPDNTSRGFVVALDARTGAVDWARPLAGDILGGPVIARDGAIGVLLGAPAVPGPTSFVVLEPNGHARGTVDLGGFDMNAVAQLFAVTEDGGFLVGGAPTPGSNDGFLALVDPAVVGGTRWAWTQGRSDSYRAATVAADGTIILATAKAIYGLEPAGGGLVWTLDSPAGCLLDVTLTSGAGLVATQCDGTAFGASD